MAIIHSMMALGLKFSRPDNRCCISIVLLCHNDPFRYRPAAHFKALTLPSRSFAYGRVVGSKRIKSWDRRWTSLLPIVRNMLRRNARVRVGKILQVDPMKPDTCFICNLTHGYCAAHLHILQLQPAAGWARSSALPLRRCKAQQG